MAGRLLAHLRAARLDRELAVGVAPWQSQSHAARALQLTSDHSRHQLAQHLREVVERSEAGIRFGDPVELACREQVRAALPEILEVEFRLTSACAVDARGIARLRELLTDAGGPCYVPIQREALKVAVGEVSRWLQVSERLPTCPTAPTSHRSEPNGQR